MKKRNRYRPFFLLGLLILILGLLGLGCICSGIRRRTVTATPTEASQVVGPTASPAPQGEETRIVQKPTTRSQDDEATPKPTAKERETPEIDQLVRWRNPAPETLSQEASELAPGTRFELVLTEGYVTEMARTYLGQVENLPVQVSDIAVDFTPDQIKVRGKVPVGFLQLAVTAAGHWKAVGCEFQAEILELRVGGQKAPASLREQVDSALQTALEASTDLSACFTAVELDETTLIVKGYRE